MSHVWWANPPQAAALFAMEHLTFVSQPVAGLIGFILFFALIGGCLGLIVRLCRMVLKLA